ncbi:MAG TPA: hypothetical protein ENN88_01685 [Candidatus Coatesbacteria bacterium]|nr:hypothetical protein [Candidatus Coatesbacteria bacterium]
MQMATSPKKENGMKLHRTIPFLFLALILAGCGAETELTDEMYARMTVDLLKAGFWTADAEKVYQEYGVSREQYEDYGKALEKDPERQRAVAEQMKEELGGDWAQWGAALGQGMAKMGLQMGAWAAEFGTAYVEALAAFIPAFEEGMAEFGTGLAEKLGELQKTLDESFGKTGETTADEAEKPGVEEPK